MKCAVITPIGPGHEELYQSCLQSINDAWQFSKGPFNQIEIMALWDLQATHGRSKKRNEGIQEAMRLHCEWIFFIDADDLMTKFSFEAFSKYFENYDGVWGNICEAPFGQLTKAKLRDEQITKMDQFEELLRFEPYSTIQMGHFIKSHIANEIKFDEEMDIGEDFRYYLRVWQSFKCVKVPEIFFINQRGAHSTGDRSGAGKKWSIAVENEILSKIAEHQLIVDVFYKNNSTKFNISNPFDKVQAVLCKGAYYLIEELELLSKFIGLNKVIVEVGSGIGNQALFYLKNLEAEKIFAFESDQQLINILEINALINAAEDKVIISKNLTIDQFVSKLLSLDKLDFLQINYEEISLDIFIKFNEIINTHKPIIFVKVNQNKLLEFNTLIGELNYQILNTISYTDGTLNYLLTEMKTP